MRISSEEKNLAAEQPGATVKLTYQCHHCGHVYAMTADDFRRAA